MESGILNKLLFVLCWPLIITLDDLLDITDTHPDLYHHCSIIKCYVISHGYEYLLRLKYHFIDCVDHISAPMENKLKTMQEAK